MRNPKQHETLEDFGRIDSFELDECGGAFLVGTRVYEYLYFLEPERDGIELMDDCGDTRATVEVVTVKNATNQRFFKCGCCGKKTRFLYETAPYLFKCQKCAGLNYQIQQRYRNYLDFYEEGLIYARANLQWDVPDGLCPIDFPSVVPPRPRYMHQNTYLKHLRKLRWYQEKYKKGADAECERIMCQEALKI